MFKCTFYWVSAEDYVAKVDMAEVFTTVKYCTFFLIWNNSFGGDWKKNQNNFWSPSQDFGGGIIRVKIQQLEYDLKGSG